MKHIYLLTAMTISLVACNESTKEEKMPTEQAIAEKSTIEYPANISKVFEAHGGLDTWNEMNTLVFTLKNEEGQEVTTTELKSRKSLIETDKFKIGFDGNEVWLDQDSTYFKNDPKFYHNLMFYFYAMPFVLADNGINYSDVEPLQFDGTSYPGVKISYNDGVGDSPEDEYFMYFNPETHKMAWLGYTVTYFSKEKSADLHYIKYNEWQEINGLQLPKTLQWYNSENGSITEMRNERLFTDIKLMKEAMPAEKFMKSSK